MQTHWHICGTDHITLCNGNMFLSTTVVLKSNNMEITKTARQFSHCHNSYADLIPAQPFTIGFAFMFKQQINFSSHSSCHIDLSNKYFNRTPPSSDFSTSINFSGMAALLSRPAPAAIVGADSPPKIIGAM